MSRQDPGASTGQPVREPKRCLCADLEPVHVLKPDGSRGKCSNSACGCREFRPKPDRDQVLDDLIAERFGHVMPPDPR